MFRIMGFVEGKLELNFKLKGLLETVFCGYRIYI